MKFISAVPRTSYNVETPHRLLAVAARIFAERGYRAVTLKDVVAAARVNSATAHYHFGDKAGLYRAVVHEQLRLRELQISIDERDLRRTAPPARLHAFISRLMRQLLLDEAHSFMPRLMLWEAIDPGPAFAVVVKQLPQRQLELLSDIIRDQVGNKLSRRQIRDSAISILGQCVYYRYGRLVLAKTEGRLPRSPAAVQKIADHIHEFSLAALTKLCKLPTGRHSGNARCRRTNGHTAARRSVKRRER